MSVQLFVTSRQGFVASCPVVGSLAKIGESAVPMRKCVFYYLSMFVQERHWHLRVPNLTGDQRKRGFLLVSPLNSYEKARTDIFFDGAAPPASCQSTPGFSLFATPAVVGRDALRSKKPATHHHPSGGGGVASVSPPKRTAHGQLP